VRGRIEKTAQIDSVARGEDVNREGVGTTSSGRRIEKDIATSRCRKRFFPAATAAIRIRKCQNVDIVLVSDVWGEGI